MNRRLPAIALAIAALDLRRRVTDPEALVQRITHLMQK